jgi:hypothetical protein
VPALRVRQYPRRVAIRPTIRFPGARRS